MHTLSDLDLSYIAGFFDGEGSITIHHNSAISPRGLVPNHTLQIAIGNTNPTVLDLLSFHFGGTRTYRVSKRKNERPMYQWTIRAASALPFLEAIRPFLRMKEMQADIAIEYQRRKKMRGPTRVTKEEFDWREEQRRRIHELNGRLGKTLKPAPLPNALKPPVSLPNLWSEET